MNIKKLLAEFELEIDDVRWYLSNNLADRLLTYVDRRKDLVTLIWSGKLEADFYRMDERFLEELQEKIDIKMMDEAGVRKIFSEILAAKKLR